MFKVQVKEAQLVNSHLRFDVGIESTNMKVKFYTCYKGTIGYIYAEVVTRVAGSLEAVGLPGYPQVLLINMMKSC